MKYIRIIIFLALIILQLANSIAQNKFFLLQGKILNEQTNLFVPKTLISIPQLNKDFETDKYGSFQVALPPDYYYMYIDNDEFQGKVIEFNLRRDTIITILLTPLIRSYLIDDVVVSANRINKVNDVQVGIERLESATINNIPTIGGEKDLIKTMQFLPGIKAGAEGNSELIVRGGSSDQNLFLLDNATLYNSVHLLGFISAYNPLSVSKADIYKAGFPSRYGGRLSSVIDVTTKVPGYTNFRGEVNIGIISSKAGFNIPIIKNKSALFISGRRTYFDLFKNPFNKKSYIESLNFHDYFIKYSHLVGNNELTLSYYGGRDKNYSTYTPIENKKISDEFNFIKANQIGNIRLESNLPIGKNSLQFNYIKYKIQITDSKQRPEAEESYVNIFNSDIDDFCIKDNLNTEINNNIVLNSGFEFVRHNFDPAKIFWSDHILDTTINRLNKSKILEADVYFDIEYNFSDMHSVLIGLRNSNYFLQDRVFPTFEPRLLYKYKLSKDFAIKTSFSSMSQPIHMLSNPGLGYPLDIWVPADNHFKPEISYQISLGTFYIVNIKEIPISLSLEGYFKTFQNIISYRDGFSSHNFSSLSKTEIHGLEDAVTQGEGRAYGIEFLAEKNSGRFSGWLGYALSWTEHQFDELNNGNYFYPRYDSRHNISVVGMYNFNKKWSAGMSWNYYTGQAITLPISSYNAVNYNYIEGKPANSPEYFLYEQSSRNTYRMKDFHCLSIEFKRNFKFKRSAGILDFGLYNAYNRKNPFYYYIDEVYIGTDSDGTRLSKRVIKSVSVFPLIPQASFTWKF